MSGIPKVGSTHSPGAINALITKLEASLDAKVPSTATMGGDLSGPIATPTVVTINGRAVSAVVFTDDARLTDSRNPLAHNASHRLGGSDAIKLDDLAAPDDNTDLNASISAHGLLPKLVGNATKYLDGTGSWSAPPSGASETVYAGPSAADIAINLASPGASLFSKNLTIAAGEVYEIEAELAILNNSGAAVTYTPRLVVGSGIGTSFFQDLALGTTIAASATNRTPLRFRGILSVISSASLRYFAQAQAGAAAAIGTANTETNALNRYLYQTSVANITGAGIPFGLNLYASSTTATQTAHLIAYRIRRIPTVA